MYTQGSARDLDRLPENNQSPRPSPEFHSFPGQSRKVESRCLISGTDRSAGSNWSATCSFSQAKPQLTKLILQNIKYLMKEFLIFCNKKHKNEIFSKFSEPFTFKHLHFMNKLWDKYKIDYKIPSWNKYEFLQTYCDFLIPCEIFTYSLRLIGK